MPRKSLTGRKFDKLTVGEYLGDKKYRCRCDCGNEIEVYSSNIKKTYSCADCKPKYYKDIRGKHFGKLKVISYDSDGKWNCECKCGRTISVKSNNLRSGNTSSCGICGYREAAQRDVVEGTRLTTLYKKKSSRNTSGYTGVYYNKRREKWFAEIMFQGKRYYLGYHLKKEDAIKSRKNAEDKLHAGFLKWFAEQYPQRSGNLKKKIKSTD